MSSLREQLEQVAERTGALTPAAVVEAAQPENSPLHPRFEWDNHLAGEAYRRVQASQLIRSVRVTYRPGAPDPLPRHFHVAPGSPDGTHTYVSVDDLADDEITSALVLRSMHRDWEVFKRRYQHLAEYLDLIRQQQQSA